MDRAPWRSPTCMIFFLLSFSYSAMSQDPSFSERIIEDTVLTYKPEPGEKFLYVPSEFARMNISRTQILDSLKECTILRVELAYSLYKLKESFDQQALNAARWKTLYADLPVLFSNNATTYFNVCQSLATTDKEAKALSHGFFIYYRKNVDSTARETEIDSLKKYVLQLQKKFAKAEVEKKEPEKVSVSASKKTHKPPHKPPVFSSKRKPKYPSACRMAFYNGGANDIMKYLNESNTYHPLFRKEGTIIAEVSVNQRGAITRIALKESSTNKFKRHMLKLLSEMGDWNPAYSRGNLIKSKVELTIKYTKKYGYEVSQRSVYPKSIKDCYPLPDDSVFYPSAAPPPRILSMSSDNLIKPTLSNVFERIDSLHRTLFVIDVTGSMYGFMIEALEILNDSIASKKANVDAVVAFNDGDAKPDWLKMRGRTGGVYYTEDIGILHLGNFFVKAMSGGGGGDTPENNIEAVLEGIEKCPECRDVVMIADNYATPRDGSLIEKIDRPMHWILCGTGFSVNPDYLDLIRKNKGWGHTASSDFSGLENLKDGDIIDIDGNKYQLRGDNFRLLK